MTRTLSFAIACLGLILAASTTVIASEGADDSPDSLKGEVVDTACYLDHKARGSKHKACALNCLASGIPPSLLTDDGKLYLLLPPHGAQDSYQKVKGMASEVVTVKGKLLSGGGLQALEVHSVN